MPGYTLINMFPISLLLGIRRCLKNAEKSIPNDLLLSESEAIPLDYINISETSASEFNKILKNISSKVMSIAVVNIRVSFF